MRCSDCGFDNRARAKFCNECGAPLTLRCSSCGTENQAGAKFCNECGISLTQGEMGKGRNGEAEVGSLQWPVPSSQPLAPSLQRRNAAN
ncbi:MAG: zinc-ribbon domain-containing protein [Candidatus Binatia bacterium]